MYLLKLQYLFQALCLSGRFPVFLNFDLYPERIFPFVRRHLNEIIAAASVGDGYVRPCKEAHGSVYAAKVTLQ
jgi:hypothetical protein